MSQSDQATSKTANDTHSFASSRLIERSEKETETGVRKEGTNGRNDSLFFSQKVFGVTKARWTKYWKRRESVWQIQLTEIVAIRTDNVVLHTHFVENGVPVPFSTGTECLMFSPFLLLDYSISILPFPSVLSIGGAIFDFALSSCPHCEPIPTPFCGTVFHGTWNRLKGHFGIQ